MACIMDNGPQSLGKYHVSLLNTALVLVTTTPLDLTAQPAVLLNCKTIHIYHKLEETACLQAITHKTDSLILPLLLLLTAFLYRSANAQKCCAQACMCACYWFWSSMCWHAGHSSQRIANWSHLHRCGMYPWHLSPHLRHGWLTSSSSGILCMYQCDKALMI